MLRCNLMVGCGVSERLLRALLLRWGVTGIRSFPWRQSRNPWEVLVAEILLQKTRAEQVVLVYEALVRYACGP